MVGFKTIRLGENGAQMEAECSKQTARLAHRMKTADLRRRYYVLHPSSAWRCENFNPRTRASWCSAKCWIRTI